MNIKTLLIDADVLVYRAGFALEETIYIMVNYDTEESIEIKDKEHALALLKINEGDYCEIKQERRLKKNSYTVQQIIKIILDSIDIEHEYKRLFITDTNIHNNFRKKLDEEYKQNRKNASKPILYDEAREVLLTKHNAELVTGYEADDAMGMEQTKDTCIVSIDKDMMMIPGWHYNLNTKEIIYSSDPGALRITDEGKIKGYGFKWFCAQMLLGDIADNIKGLKGYGPIKVYKQLKDLVHPKELFQKVSGLYDQEGRKEDLTKNAQLLWIYRENKQSFFDYMEDINHDRQTI